MQYINSVKAASKAKAPIVAIPVEGHAPACIDRKRLTVWSKGVTINRVEVETHYQLETLRAVYVNNKGYVTPEGPQNRVVGHRYLVIEGIAGRVKTCARFNVIDRRTAMKTLAVWSERERAKQQKKVMLGALSKDERRVLRLAKHDDIGALVPVDVKMPSGRVRAYGAPVTIAELAEFEFVVHRSVESNGEIVDNEWIVSERISGLRAGHGSDATSAIAHARTQARNAKPETLAKIRTQIAETVPSVAA